MRFLFFIMVVYSLYSCSENKANAKEYSDKNTALQDSVYVKDTTPVYQYLFDTALADGFIYPVKWETKPTDRNFSFLKKIYTEEGQNPDSLTEWFQFNPKSRDFVTIQMPANGYFLNVKIEMNGLITLTTYHTFIENGFQKYVIFEIEGIDSMYLNSFNFISKGTVLGRARGIQQSDKLSVKISVISGKFNIPLNRNSPTKFIKDYTHCILPKKSDKLIFAHKGNYKMYYFEKGILKNEYDIALSQNPVGHKQRQGDNKLPEGLYRITEKSRGPFYGDTGPWLGVAWMQFSYPNQYDAVEGYKNGTITLSEMNAIVYADKNMKPTNSYTNLGGRVGIHGWNGDWIANGTQNLTWGCISMFNRDIDVFYDLIPLNTPIIIMP